MPPAAAEVITLDLSDVEPSRGFAALPKKHKVLDILVNNAGLNTTGGTRPTTTKQGYEICMGTSAGHSLTALLMPALMASEDARVVALSSVTWFASNKYHYVGASKTKGNYAASSSPASPPPSSPRSDRREVPRQQRPLRRRRSGLRRGRVAPSTSSSPVAARSPQHRRGRAVPVRGFGPEEHQEGAQAHALLDQMSKLFGFNKERAYAWNAVSHAAVHGFAPTGLSQGEEQGGHRKLWALSIGLLRDRPGEGSPSVEASGDENEGGTRGQESASFVIRLL